MKESKTKQKPYLSIIISLQHEKEKSDSNPQILKLFLLILIDVLAEM